MTIRRKIADWITGGELSTVKDINKSVIATLDDVERERDKVRAIKVKQRHTLEEIAAIHVTPESNGTLRKAVRLAREALNDGV